MRRSWRVYRWVGTVVAALLLMVGNATARDYGLDELVDEAMRTSREVKKVEAELVKAEEQIWEAKGGAFPNISLSANYQYAWDQYSPFGLTFETDAMPTGSTATMIHGIYQQYGLPGAPLDAGDSAIALFLDGLLGAVSEFSDIELPRNTLALSLSLQQPLFAQGKVTVGLRIARQYRKTLLCKFNAVRQEAKAGITKLFYGALLAKRNMEICDAAVGISEEVHRLTVLRQGLGTGSQVDTLSSRLNLEKARMARRQAAGNLRTAYEALIKQAGLSESVEEFSVAGEFPNGDYDISLDDALVTFHQQSKVLGQLNGGERVQEELVTLHKTDYLPLVYCGASLSKYLIFDAVDEIDWDKEGQNDGRVFVGASFTLFNGLKRMRKIRQAKQDLTAFQLTKDQTIDRLELGIRDAWERVQSGREQLESARALVALAEKGYALAGKAYEVGQMTLVEMQQRELDLNSARMALNAAQFGFHSAVLDLQLLMGAVPLHDEQASLDFGE